MRQTAKPRPRARQRPQIQSAVLNAGKRVDETRTRGTRAPDPSRKIRTPVAELTRSARTQQKSQRVPATTISGDGWDEEPTLIQRENVLKRVGTRPTTGGRMPSKPAPPVERKARPATRPALSHDNLDEVPTKVLPAMAKREAESARKQATREPPARRVAQPAQISTRIARPVQQGANVEPIALRQRRAKNSEQRWLLLLKVGKEQLARVWNQGLESCEPIVWRPTTKAWAPLFDVPQIAAFVTSIPPEMVAASTAPPAAPDTVRSPPPSGVVPATAAFGTLAELSTERAGPSHLALRSPTIPRAPRVPRDTVKGPFGRLGEAVSPLGSTSQGARATVRPPAPAASPTPALKAEREIRATANDIQRRATAETIPPVTERAEPPHVARPDSFAPQVRSVPSSRERVSERGSGQVVERVAWLMVGVVLALVLTLFPEVTYQLRTQLASWIAPEPDTVQGTAMPGGATDAPQKTQPSADSRAKQSSAAAKKDDGKPEKNETSAVAVDELFANPRDKKGSDQGEDETKSAKDADEDGAGSKKKASGASSEDHGAVASLAKSAPSRRATAKPQAKASGSGFDTGAARMALASAVQRAQFCAAERAYGTVTVTFAPSGGVQGVGLNLRGQDVRKGCVARAFRGARIRPFDGSAVTVQKKFQLR